VYIPGTIPGVDVIVSVAVFGVVPGESAGMVTEQKGPVV
jgi:hypothetical protein